MRNKFIRRILEIIPLKIIKPQSEIMRWKYLWNYLIGLQNEIIQKLRVICEKIHLGQMDEYLDKLMDGKTAAQSYEELKTVLAEDKDNLKMLYCQLECARRVFDRYQEKTEECFWQGMVDLPSA